MSVELLQLVRELDNFFELSKLSQDPSMKVFIPQVYKDYKLPIEDIFEKEFLRSFNGLMVSGGDTVHTVFTASFPHEEVLEKFINQSQNGDLLFLHHPIPLECGDPKGTVGKGFLPLNPVLLNKIIEKGLSIYSCHAPLDYNKTISTNRAISQALGVQVEDEFLPYGNGFAGLITKISNISTDSLIEKLKKIFNIPYADFAGKKIASITKLGIVAGGGDEIEYSQECLKRGCQAYLTGEVFSRQESDWAKKNIMKMQEYVKSVNISLIGVSHAASEFLVMRTQIPSWIENKFMIKTVPIPQKKWWI